MNLNFQNKDRSLLTNQSGFTLLEILISMAVLVFISFAIYQATIETYKLRDSLLTEGNFYNGIRLSTSIMQTDISMLYSPLLAIPEKKEVDAKGQSQANGNLSSQAPLPVSGQISGDLSQSSTFWSPAVNPEGVRPSHFIGSETKMSFISVSHSRIYRDSPESEFAKITYETKRDTQTLGPGASVDTLVLIKTENPNAFSMDDGRDPLSRSYEILHGIKKLSFTYYQKDGNTWKTSRSWDNEREETKNIYPDVIEMNIEVIGPQRQSFEGIYKFRPELPLNGLDPST
jgi:prepilin-type N-terminal cleavage/methylation domain-containing protein